MRHPVEQAVAATFAAVKPEALVSLPYLMAKAFPDVRWIENKHRASLSRAVKSVAAREGWVRLELGRSVFYCRKGSRAAAARRVR
jgi:hypothetical protein